MRLLLLCALIPVAGSCALFPSLDGLTGDGGVGDGSINDVDAGFADGGRTLLFDDEFDGSMDPRWVVLSGTWNVVGGELVESDASSGGTIYVGGFQDAGFYEAVSSMRMTGTAPVADDAMELTVRLSQAAGNPRLLTSFEPGDWYIRFLLPPGSSFGDHALSPGSNSMQSFTLHTRLDPAGGATTVHTWVDELPGSDTYTTLTSSQVPAGTFGLVTYNHGAAFDWLRVYSIP